MKGDGLQRILHSPELTKGEKMYILDYQYHMGGSFSQALFAAISRADFSNRMKLALGFPDEVQGYVAWSEGDLYERASKIAGDDVRYVEGQAKPNNHES